VRRAAPTLVAVLAGLLAAGCGAPAPSLSAPLATPPPTLAATEAVSPGLPSAVASTPGATPGATGPGAVEDPSLIAVLPADVDGNPVVLESQAFTEAMSDRSFAVNVESAAFGVVVSGDDLASAVVAKPVDGVFSEAWFRDWRDSYNEGACERAGGVARNAEAELGGRTVYIGTCAEDLRTYHAWLEDRGLLVSAFSVGESRFGERLMAGLRP
jgi:hypothetical protein